MGEAESGNGAVALPKREFVYLEHNPRKVALVCMGPSVVDFFVPTLTQEFDPAWVDEVWTINMAVNAIRSDVVFWLDDLIAQQNFKPKLFVALRKYGIPVITSTRRPEVVPNSFDFPINEVGSIGVGVFGKPYLNNGVAMAIGYALWKGVTDMYLFGADFTYPGRDFAESGRACTEAWITLAAMRELKVHLPPRTSIFDMVRDGGVYGYSEQPAIHLPDGRIFQYQRASEVGPYVAEDSSGKASATSAS